MLKWGERGRAATLDATACEFYAKWRPHIQLAPDKSGFNFLAWIVDERSEREDADRWRYDQLLRWTSTKLMTFRVAVNRNR